MKRAIVGVVVCVLGATAFSAGGYVATAQEAKKEGDAAMKLGNFSISLAVKDIEVSRAFYEKLGFRNIAGNAKQKWLIMQNDASTVGLFEGHGVTKNTLTYNPGWDRNSATLPEFQDVRDIQRELKSKGLELSMTADENSTGPAALMLMDPDGNPILIDQHVAKGKK